MNGVYPVNTVIFNYLYYTMAAPKKNQFWKARTTHGRDKIFSSAEVLYAAACEYFEWSDANPWYKSEAIKSGDMAGKCMKIPTARPYTIKSLCLFLDINEVTYQRYRKEADFQEATERIDKIIYTQKFEGAVVGVFNANIISRDLGLAEKVEATNTNYNHNTKSLTPEEIREIHAALEAEY